LSWPSVPLGELYAKRSPSVDPRRFPGEEFELFSVPAHDRGAADIEVAESIGSSKITVEPGDVLLCRIVPHIRRSWIVTPERGHRQIASGEWMVFRDPRFEPAFLRHYLISGVFHRQFMTTVAGVGGSLMRARPAHAAAIGVPLPPLPEQRRIASILDGTQRLVENQRRADLLSAALSARIFQDRFLNAPEREWRVLGDVADFRSGATPSKANHDYWAGSVPWFSPKDLKSNSLRDSIDHVSESALRETSIGQFEPDTVVFVTRGMILAHSFPVSIVTVPFTMNQDLKALALREKTDPWFLAFALRSQTPTVLASVSNSGHGTKRIETDFLRRLRLPWATEAEQLSFGVLARELEASDRRRASRRDLAMRLTRSVQDQAFKGKL